jgi:hypothetical protein
MKQLELLVAGAVFVLFADVLDWYQCNLPKDSPDQQQHELEDVESGEGAAGASSKQQQQHLLPKHGNHLQRKTVSEAYSCTTRKACTRYCCPEKAVSSLLMGTRCCPALSVGSTSPIYTCHVSDFKADAAYTDRRQEVLLAA